MSIGPHDIKGFASRSMKIHPLPLGEGRVRVQDLTRLVTLTRRFAAPPSPKGRGICLFIFHRIESQSEVPFMAKKTKTKSVDRRNFLKTAAASAALAVTKPGAAEAQQAPPTPRNASAPVLARPVAAPAAVVVDEAKTIDRKSVV